MFSGLLFSSSAMAGGAERSATRAAQSVITQLRKANGGFLPTGRGASSEVVVGNHRVYFFAGRGGQAPTATVASSTRGKPAPDSNAVMALPNDVVMRHYTIEGPSITRKSTVMHGDVARTFEAGGGIKVEDYRGYHRWLKGDKTADPFVKEGQISRTSTGRFMPTVTPASTSAE